MPTFNARSTTKRQPSTPSVNVGDPKTIMRDRYFGFLPGNGVHDIHMNQGNAGRFIEQDGVWQDGSLLFHYPAMIGAAENCCSQNSGWEYSWPSSRKPGIRTMSRVIGSRLTSPLMRNPTGAFELWRH